MIFVIVITLLSACASINYVICGDTARALYWFAAALINTSTLLMR